MANCVVFYGHGELMQGENPGKAAVPTGCKLLLFARHKEVINTHRMQDIVLDLIDNGLGARYIRYKRGRRWVPGFISRMKDAGHLRRVKDAGQQVHNYRLFPQDKFTRYVDSVEGVFEAVTTEDDAGVPLATLMERHGRPGTTMLWVPCRAVEGLGAQHTPYDLYDAGDTPAEVYNSKGELEGQGYVRPRHGQYYKRS
jgi:hypothetical protein